MAHSIAAVRALESGLSATAGGKRAPESRVNVPKRCTTLSQATAGAKTVHRGKATIPLRGIDVPFHSFKLRGGVDRFRQALLAGLPTGFDIEWLQGRYIPNLTGASSQAKPQTLSLSRLGLCSAYS